MGIADNPGIARRGFMGALAGLVIARELLVGEGGSAQAAPVDSANGSVRFGRHSLHFADLTHKLTREFNFGATPPRISMESVDGSGVAVGMKMHRLSLIEHTGTHMDAPSHFGEAYKSLGDIGVSDLITPLAVIDITAKAANNRFFWLHRRRWERRSCS